MDDARKKYQDVIDHANANNASLAKLALAQARSRPESRLPMRRSLLKDLMDHPDRSGLQRSGDHRLRAGYRHSAAGRSAQTSHASRQYPPPTSVRSPCGAFQPAAEVAPRGNAGAPAVSRRGFARPPLSRNRNTLTATLSSGIATASFIRAPSAASRTRHRSSPPPSPIISGTGSRILWRSPRSRVPWRASWG